MTEKTKKKHKQNSTPFVPLLLCDGLSKKKKDQKRKNSHSFYIKLNGIFSIMMKQF